MTAPRDLFVPHAFQEHSIDLGEVGNDLARFIAYAMPGQIRGALCEDPPLWASSLPS